MIATWRGLAIATGLAALLAIIVVVDLARTPATRARALLPGFDPARTTELVWERPGRPALRALRDGETWQLVPATHDPAGSRAALPADPGAIGDVLAALRGARWHREGAPAAVRATLTVRVAGERHVLGLGAPIAGTEQSWIAVGDRGLVVDSWVTRALDRDALALRMKAPLAEVARAPAIRIQGAAGVDLRIAGHPRRIGAVPFVLAAELAVELERALTRIAIVRIPDGPVPARGLAIDLGGALHVAIGGSCAGSAELVALSGTTGDGCIERAVADDIERVVARLQQAPSALVERRPVPFEPQRVTLLDGATLDLAALRVGDTAADLARVQELALALATPADPVALPAGPAEHHLEVTTRDGAALALDLFADRVLARRGEPLGLRLAPGAWSLVLRRSRDLRDPTLWLEEPTTITSLRIDDVRYQRGAIIGAWTRQPPGALDVKAVDALVLALAAPRAVGFLDDDPAIAHRVTLEITPPGGAPTERSIAIGAPRATGCPARIARDTVILPAAICRQVAALAR